VRNISCERRLDYNEDDNSADDEDKNDDNEYEYDDDNHKDHEEKNYRQACGTSLVSGGWIVTYNEDDNGDDNEDDNDDDNEDDNDDDNEDDNDDNNEDTNYDDIHHDYEGTKNRQACRTSVVSGGWNIMRMTMMLIMRVKMLMIMRMEIMMIMRTQIMMIVIMIMRGKIMVKRAEHLFRAEAVG